MGKHIVLSFDESSDEAKTQILINNFIVLKNFGINIGIAVLFCLGFLLMSSQSYACAKKVSAKEFDTCVKSSLKKLEDNRCCQTGTCEKNKHHRNCNGVCGHSTCKCSTSISSLNLPIAIELASNYPFSDIEKKKFGDQNDAGSSGFLSIWLPPKIS